MPGRPLEFHGVAFRIRDVERRPHALGTVTLLDRPDLVTPGLQLRGNLLGLERLDLQAEMIQIASFLSGRCAAGAAEFAIDGHEIDQTASRAELDKPDILLTFFEHTPQRITIKLQHGIELRDAKDNMVNARDT